uniref:autotransporter outer membrane beta-barrel domain-containing protein n=1 Tax=Fusobacterium varium TaxID=856 RepID=UPI00242AC692|nr:autotransporter outer membrane beta-barrel domain-containing protein [Fusobacterium varium]
MKAVKSSNKRRGRNITIGTVIVFLLSCTAVMGVTEGNYLWIKDNNGIKFSTDNSEPDSQKNPYEDAGNTWSKDVYTNNITLSGNDVYGLKLELNSKSFEFINNGIIISGSKEYDGGQSGYSGYGIHNEKSEKIAKLSNNGIILGNIYNVVSNMGARSYGYGIYNENGTITNLTNSGLIFGNISISSQNFTYNYGCGIQNKGGTITNLTNSGLISGNNNSNMSINYSYGIQNGGGEITKLVNSGLILGINTAEESMQYYSSGIVNSGTITNLTNSGIISGSSSSSSSRNSSNSGIMNSGTITNLDNSGLIFGNANSSEGNRLNNSYGIYNEREGTITKTITNIGIISGGGNTSSGSGIYNENKEITSLNNNGLIFGSGITGSGIVNSNGNNGIGKLINTGIISSNTNSTNSYGIFNINMIKTIINAGLISGNGSSNSDSVYGIYNKEEIKDLTNTGVIYGKTNAIKNETGGAIGTVNNYGILATKGSSEVDGLTISDNYGLIIKNGKEIVVGSKEEKNVNIPVTYNTDGKVSGTRNMTIKNQIDTTGDESFTGNENDSILNALTNTYKVTGLNDEVAGSIINAYGTAVVFGDVGDNNQLTLSGTVVNGGIEDSTNGIAISGSGNGDTLILQSGTVEYTDGSKGIQNTIVNGNINMGAGADTLTIGDGTIINGTLDGGDSDSKDTLNFGISSVTKSNPADSQEIRIMHNISNFENINVGEDTNVTLFEKTIGADGKETDLKVSGVNEINIKAGGVLNLRIDSRKLSDNGKYEGHALFGNIDLIINGDISQLPDGKTEIKEEENGKYNVGVFNLVTNGLRKDAIIAMEGITLNENLFVKTNSILDKAVILKESEENGGKGEKGDIKIEWEIDIFEINKNLSRDEPKYIKLNEIYKGIYSSKEENFNGLKDILTLTVAGEDYTSVTDKKQMAILLSYLNKIYTASPYSFSSELSRRSAGMFRDIVTENQFRPDLNRWLVMGGLTHRDGGTKDSYYGQNYHEIDGGTADVDVDMKLTGAYALGKYGYSENVSLGVTAGGNKSEAKLPMSKVKGNSGYIGAFAENYRGNLTLKAGGGIQYSEYDANRVTLGGHSYSEKYSDMTYDIYLNGRYSHNIGENLFLEPYGTLSYTYIKQDSADEGSKVLAIETDSKSFDYTAAKMGLDLKKVIPHEKGKSTLSAGVSYTRLLTGADEENITGRFKGGSDFDILVAHKNEHSIGLNAKYALELESGILFDVKGSYNVERDSYKGSGKNRNKGEWIVGAGIGYKF